MLPTMAEHLRMSAHLQVLAEWRAGRVSMQWRGLRDAGFGAGVLFDEDGVALLPYREVWALR